LGIDRVELRDAKYDRYEGDPEHGGDCDWVAAVERSSYKSICVDEVQGGRNSYDRIIHIHGKEREFMESDLRTVGYVEPDSGWA
jgi:hypothetical protein